MRTAFGVYGTCQAVVTSAARGTDFNVLWLEMGIEPLQERCDILDESGMCLTDNFNRKFAWEIQAGFYLCFVDHSSFSFVL